MDTELCTEKMAKHHATQSSGLQLLLLLGLGTLPESVLEPASHVLHVAHAAGTNGSATLGLLSPIVISHFGGGVSAGSTTLLLDVVRHLSAPTAGGVGLVVLFSAGGGSFRLYESEGLRERERERLREAERERGNGDGECLLRRGLCIPNQNQSPPRSHHRPTPTTAVGHHHHHQRQCQCRCCCCPVFIPPSSSLIHSISTQVMPLE